MKYLHIDTDQKGFTLVEMVVSLAIFSIVALVAIGALLRITDANKKSQSLKTAINNLNFALESMSREMRVGYDYNGCISLGSGYTITQENFVSDPCNRGGGDEWVMTFRSSKQSPPAPAEAECNLIHSYWYKSNGDDTSTILKAEQETCDDDIEEDDFHELISPDIKLTNSSISVTVPTIGKPKVFFWLKGYAGAREREKTDFEVQTSISQRI